MRLLVGNDVDEFLLPKADVRAWTQRILWFAEDGDVLLLKSTPNPDFVAHVTSLTGVDASTLRIHIAPGASVEGNFDGWALLDKAFQDAVFEDLGGVTEVLALWPSSQVAWLAESLEVGAALPGSAFIKQGGGEVANSKAVFRAVAAAAGVPIPDGGVCRTLVDAVQLSSHLLLHSDALIVKRAFGGAGAANEILAVCDGLRTSHAGNRGATRIKRSAEALWAYWDSRWGWASDDETHPFVVEAFIRDARSVYVEFSCDAAGVGPGRVGELLFGDGALTREVFPAHDIPADALVALHRHGDRLARAYWHMGYRGPFSADAVLTVDGRVLFTEVNAQYTGSTHLYRVIADRVVGVGGESRRCVVQCLSPASWSVPSLRAFLDGVEASGHAYDVAARRGVIAVTPQVELDGSILFCVVAARDADVDRVIDDLGRAFTRGMRPKDAAPGAASKRQ
jgi:hypothetical protein